MSGQTRGGTEQRQRDQCIAQGSGWGAGRHQEAWGAQQGWGRINVSLTYISHKEM